MHSSSGRSLQGRYHWSQHQRRGDAARIFKKCIKNASCRLKDGEIQGVVCEHSSQRRKRLAAGFEVRSVETCWSVEN